MDRLRRLLGIMNHKFEMDERGDCIVCGEGPTDSAHTLMQPDMDGALQQFIEALEDSLERRYNACQDFAATPSAILLDVLNAVAEAREKVEKGKLK